METLLFSTVIIIAAVLIFLIYQKAEKQKVEYSINLNEATNKLQITEFDLNQKNNVVQQQELTIQNQKIELDTTKTNLIRSEAENGTLKEKLETQITEIQKLHATHLEQFELISNRVLKENSPQIRDLNVEAINNIVNPLKEKLASFEEKVQNTYEKQLKDTTVLTEHISSLSEMSKQIGQDAVNLTNALRGDKKMQGNWGETILETVLEKSGLLKDVHYRTQVSLTSDTGETKRPDVVISLPDTKSIIIDSKVSLVAYNDYCNCDDAITQKEKLQEHVNAIKNHIKSLSDKKYDQLLDINTPEYVLMFIPIEPAFMLAVQDQTLFHFALEKNVVLVSSSTLLATLRTVASIWKQENQTKNVLEIASEAGKLYDKFVGFTEDMQSISDNINKTSKSFDAAMNKLTEGSGNVMNRFEKMKKLGAKATKSIDAKLLIEE